MLKCCVCLQNLNINDWNVLELNQTLIFSSGKHKQILTACRKKLRWLIGALMLQWCFHDGMFPCRMADIYDNSCGKVPVIVFLILSCCQTMMRCDTVDIIQFLIRVCFSLMRTVRLNFSVFVCCKTKPMFKKCQKCMESCRIRWQFSVSWSLLLHLYCWSWCPTQITVTASLHLFKVVLMGSETNSREQMRV